MPKEIELTEEYEEAKANIRTETRLARNGASYSVGTETLRQAAMPGAFRGMDEHIDMVVQAVRDMASQLVDRGLTAAISNGIEIAGRFATDDGVLMDSVIKISMKAKPAKVE